MAVRQGGRAPGTASLNTRRAQASRPAPADRDRASSRACGMERSAPGLEAGARTGLPVTTVASAVSGCSLAVSAKLSASTLAIGSQQWRGWRGPAPRSVRAGSPAGPVLQQPRGHDRRDGRVAAKTDDGGRAPAWPAWARAAVPMASAPAPAVSPRRRPPAGDAGAASGHEDLAPPAKIGRQRGGAGIGHEDDAVAAGEKFAPGPRPGRRCPPVPPAAIMIGLHGWARRVTWARMRPAGGRVPAAARGAEACVMRGHAPSSHPQEHAHPERDQDRGAAIGDEGQGHALGRDQMQRRWPC